MFQGVPQEMAQLRIELLSSARAENYSSYLAAEDFEGAASVVNLADPTIIAPYSHRLGAELIAGIALTDWTGISDAERQYVSTLVSAVDGVDLGVDPVRANIQAIFGEAAEPMLNKTPANRAELMYGVGSAVGGSHVQNAYTYPDW